MQQPSTRLRRAFAAVVVAGVAAGVSIAGATAAEAYTYTGCKWSSVSVLYNDTTSGVNRTAFEAGASQWSAKTDVNMSSNTGAANFFFNAAAAGTNGNDGASSWTCNSGKYFNVGSTINTTYTNGYSAVNRQKVATHEIGHGLGLQHSNINTIMYYASHLSNVSVPASDDINGINALY